MLNKIRIYDKKIKVNFYFKLEFSIEKFILNRKLFLSSFEKITSIEVLVCQFQITFNTANHFPLKL